MLRGGGDCFRIQSFSESGRRVPFPKQYPQILISQTHDTVLDSFNARELAKWDGKSTQIEFGYVSGHT